MKYLLFLLVPVLIAGCSPYGDSSDKSEEIKIYKKQLDSLKTVKQNQQHILDSLEKASKLQEEQLKFIQIQQDSLSKNLNQENK